MLQRHWRAPSYSRAEKSEAEALDLLAQILGGGATSRLYRSLVADRKIAAYAAAWYGGTAVDETRFSVWASPLPTSSLAELETAIGDAIALLVRDGVPEAELERAKTRLVADAIYARDSQSTLARHFGTTLSTGGTVEDLLGWPARIAAVTADEVRHVAEVYLAGRHSVVGLLEGKPASPSLT